VNQLKVTLAKLRNVKSCAAAPAIVKLTWLALGEDQAARSRRVEQLTAL